MLEQTWPSWDEALTIDDTVTVVIQVNGKLRGQFVAPVAASKEDLEAAARINEKVLPHLEGKTIKKVIVIPKKLVNFVVA
jgi:leucyl-tRNA synthetase